LVCLAFSELPPPASTNPTITTTTAPTSTAIRLLRDISEPPDRSSRRRRGATRATAQAGDGPRQQGRTGDYARAGRVNALTEPAGAGAPPARRRSKAPHE